MRVSRGWGDCGDDAGGGFGGAGGDAGVAATEGGSNLVDEIDNGTFVAIEEADELAEIRRKDVVVDGVEVAVIGHVERIDTKTDMVLLAAPVTKERHAKLAVEFHVQRKIFRETLAIRRADVLLLNIDRRVRKSGMNVDKRAKRKLPRQSENSPADNTIRNV